MEELPRLKARIERLEELRDMVRAMRAMAASRVQEAQASLAGIRRYAEVVEDSLAEGAALLDDAEERPPGALPGNDVLIVVCSEHGFTGAFSETLLNDAISRLQPNQRLGVLGARGAMLAEERGIDLAWRFPTATHVSSVPAVARRLADHLGDVRFADIVYGAYRAGGNYEIERRTILPIDPALLKASTRRSPPLHHLDPVTLLSRLTGEYLFAEITRAIMESLASENGARLRVMSAADGNIGDKLTVLRQEEQTLRQQVITSELLDIVIGAEAVSDDGRSSGRH